MLGAVTSTAWEDLEGGQAFVLGPVVSSRSISVGVCVSGSLGATTSSRMAGASEARPQPFRRVMGVDANEGMSLVDAGE